MPGPLTKLLTAAPKAKTLKQLGPVVRSSSPEWSLSQGALQAADRSAQSMDVRGAFPSQPVTPGKGVTVDGIRFVDGVHANLYTYGKQLEASGRGSNQMRTGMWNEFEPVAAEMHDPESPFQGPKDVDALARDYYRSVTDGLGSTRIGGSLVQPDDRAVWAATHPDHEPRFKRGGALSCK